MRPFLCIHTFTPGMISQEQIQQFAQMAQQEEEVHGLHSYLNLSEGKAVCIFEAQNRSALEEFFKRMGMPVDSIVPVEMQGDRGVMHNIAQETAQSTVSESMYRRQD